MNKKVLIVDDVNEYLDKLGETISNYADVYKASGVLEASLLIREIKFDAIISDFYLQDGLGNKLFCLAKEIQPEMQCIAVSGYKLARIEKKHGKITCIEHFIQKPFNREKMDLIFNVINGCEKKNI